MAIPESILARSPTAAPRPFREPPTQAADGEMARTVARSSSPPSPHRHVQCPLGLKCNLPPGLFDSLYRITRRKSPKPCVSPLLQSAQQLPGLSTRQPPFPLVSVRIVGHSRSQKKIDPHWNVR